MKVFMTGGTGFVGTCLTRKLAEQGCEVTVLTRAIRKGRDQARGVSFLEGDPTMKGAWQERVVDHEVIINLAGATIFTRWTQDKKEAIRNSRIMTTQNLVEALSVCNNKETLLLNTSAVGYYGFHGDEDLDESSPPGDDFLAAVTREWEASALEAKQFGVRVLLCRFGVILGKNGGALAKMAPLFKWYLGSRIGKGEQWFSWIHEQDLADAYLFLIDQKDFSGSINCTAPYPVTNKEMTKILGNTLNRQTLMPPVPGFVIKLMIGEFGSSLLEGQKVLPRKLLDMGFHFRFPSLGEALVDLL